MSKESRLVQLLTEKTIDGTTNWTPTAEENEFITSVGDKTISIKAAPSDDPAGPDVVFAVLDEDGREVLSIKNGDNAAGVGYGELTTLHELARRSAFKVDKTLDKIIEDLESDIPF